MTSHTVRDRCSEATQKLAFLPLKRLVTFDLPLSPMPVVRAEGVFPMCSFCTLTRIEASPI